MMLMTNRLINRVVFGVFFLMTATVVQGELLNEKPATNSVTTSTVPMSNYLTTPLAEGRGASLNAPSSLTNSTTATPMSESSFDVPQGLQLQVTPLTQQLQKLEQQTGKRPTQSDNSSQSNTDRKIPKEGSNTDVIVAPPQSNLETNFNHTIRTVDAPKQLIPQQFDTAEISQFGYSFFQPKKVIQPKRDGYNTTHSGLLPKDAKSQDSVSENLFAPQDDVPVGEDYIIGPGDSIVLTLWGSINGTYTLDVNRSGEVSLPTIGTIQVAGLRFSKLSNIFQTNISRIYKNFQLTVNIGKLRMIKVYLVGEVKAPGDYNISSMDTLINALSAAGGPTKIGSLRKIQIKRNGQLAETVDLYDFFLNGDKSHDIRLQGGDTILVPPIGSVVGIAGAVRRPAIYEITGSTTLKGLIDMAGGLLPTTYLQRIQIIRTQANEKVYVVDRNISPSDTGKTQAELLDSIKLSDRDTIKIFPIDRTPRGYVHLKGNVLRPGDYALKTGYSVSDLLKQAELLPQYNKDYGQIIRLNSSEILPEAILFNVEEALKNNPVHNHLLKEFDEVNIYNRWESEDRPYVSITGEVHKPGTFPLMKEMTLRDLLIMAGTPRLSAYTKEAEIIRRKVLDNTVRTFPIKVSLEHAMSNDPKNNLPLEPFDTINVRQIPNWTEETGRFVTLKGEFVFPGIYPIFKGERLSSVFLRAGGFTERAYLRGAKFTRESVREIQQQRMDEFIAKTEQEINRKIGEMARNASSKEDSDSARMMLEGIKSNIEKLKGLRAEGRLIQHFDSLDKFTNSKYDITASNGDKIDIPSTPDAVSVLGRVVNPSSFIALNDYTVGYYLEKAGGVTRDSDDSEIYVIRVDGSIFSRQQYSSISSLVGRGFFNETLYAGDVIVVPERLDRIAWITNIKDITTILAQLAISAGTVMLGLK